MGAVEYEHVEGLRLTPKQLDVREQEGWTIAHHFCTTEGHHTYAFRRKKD